MAWWTKTRPLRYIAAWRQQTHESRLAGGLLPRHFLITETSSFQEVFYCRELCVQNKCVVGVPSDNSSWVSLFVLVLLTTMNTFQRTTCFPSLFLFPVYLQIENWRWDKATRRPARNEDNSAISSYFGLAVWFSLSLSLAGCLSLSLSFSLCLRVLH